MIEKTYRVRWQSPNHSGEVTIRTNDFRNVGLTALRAVAPPVECPTVITHIELIEPGQYLKTEDKNDGNGCLR